MYFLVICIRMLPNANNPSGVGAPPGSEGTFLTTFFTLLSFRNSSWLNGLSTFLRMLLRLLFSCSVVSYSLQPHGLQHARLTCALPSPGTCWNSCPLSWWCHPTISSSVTPFSPALNLSQHQGFSNESALHIRWPKYWSFSFSISPSDEYSGLISLGLTGLISLQCTSYEMPG